MRVSSTNPIRNQQRTIPKEMRVGRNFSENDAHSSRREVGGSVLENSLSNSRASRSRRDEHGVNYPGSDRARHDPVDTETHELSITLGDTGEVLVTGSPHGFGENLGRAFHPRIFLLLPFQQSKRGGEVLFARRADFESLQGGSKHWRAHYLYM